MKCPECGYPLVIAKSKFVSDKDSTDVYNELTMVCINSKIDPMNKTPVCSLYAGPDLQNPKKVAHIQRNKVG
jgi:hypothetical protein